MLSTTLCRSLWLIVHLQNQHLRNSILENCIEESAIISNLKQFLDINRIQVASIFTDHTSADVYDQFITSISSPPGVPIQWNILRIADNRVASLPKRTFTFLPMANSKTVWFIVFIERLVFGRELCDHCQNRRLRETHHLSIVLVLNDAVPSTSSDIAKFLSYVWKYTEPMDLVAIHCPRNNCTAFRFYPEEGLTMTAEALDYHNIYRPQSFPAALRQNRPPNSTTDQFIAKFDINFLSAFPMIDVPHEHRDRLLGFFVWTGQLLADLLNKRLHVVTYTSDLVAVRKFDSSSLLDWMDRFELQITYTETKATFLK